MNLARSLTRRVSLLAVIALVCATSVLAVRPDPSNPATAEARDAAWQQHEALVGASPFHGLEWRSVGPVIQGGRVVDIESVPGEPYTFYVAYASGGLWKTTNNGLTFEPLFDSQPTTIMGDIAVDPQHPDTIWVGTGENTSSRSSYGGMGIFRSDDAGKTWRSMGLKNSDRIGRILVDPRDSNRVWVASLGKLYTEGGERGIYRTDDGGETWTRALAPEGGPMTGFVDLVMDPTNPDTLYAAAWERSRTPWNFVESGPGSGVYQTTDGGKTWNRLVQGFPQGDKVGRIGIDIAASQPQTLYASVDNQEILPEDQWDLGDQPITPKRLRKMTKEEFLAQDPDAIEDFIRSNDLDTSLDAKKLIAKIKSGEVTIADLLEQLKDANADLFSTDIKGLEIYRSDDGGATWHRTHEKPLREVVYTYGYYFGQIRVDPKDPEHIYAVGVPLITSKDGGKTFEGINGLEVHGDYHPVWIDANYPDRIFVGNDGGIDMSYDGGSSWVNVDAQPVGQFYSIELDMAEPFNIYGGLQDNGVLKGSSDSKPGIDKWSYVGGGDGMQVQVDPRDNMTTYWGFQFGYYFRNDKTGRHMVRPRSILKQPSLRYNWQSPIHLSAHNYDILYFGADKLFRSLDQGETWTAISDDLTRSKERGDVPFATLTSVDESPKQFGLIWAGTDDGYVWVTEDGGVNWSDVSDGLPHDRWVSRVEPSHHARERAYVSLNGYREDDITAYVYMTDDLGKTWTSISAGLPSEAVNVIREDPVNQDVLYVGTDRGVYVSLDRGKSWTALQDGLPNVPVHDLKVHPRDRMLVAGTHGRSVWVVDVLPVQEWSKVKDDAVHVFPVEDVKYSRGWKGRESEWFRYPQFDPKMEIPFWSKEDGTATLTILDGDKRPLRKMTMDVKAGMNTFTWDLKLDETMALAAEKAKIDAEKKAAKKSKKKDTGIAEGSMAKTPWTEAVKYEWPLYVTPGSYSINVSVGKASASTDLTVKPAKPRDPRMKPPMKIRGQKDGDKRAISFARPEAEAAAEPEGFKK